MDDHSAQRLIDEKEKEIHALREQHRLECETKLCAVHQQLLNETKKAELHGRELQEARENLRGCQDTLRNCQSTLKCQTQLLDEKKTELQSCRETKESLQTELQTLRMETEKKIEVAVLKCRQEIEVLGQTRAKETAMGFQRHKEAWRIEKATFKAALADAEQEIKLQKELRSKVEVEAERFKEALAEQHKQSIKTEQELQRVSHQQKQELEAINSQSNNEIQHLKAELQKIENENHKMDAELSQALEAMKMQEETKDLLQQALEEKTQMLETNERELESLQNSLHSARNEQEQLFALHQHEMEQLRHALEKEKAELASSAQFELDQKRDLIAKIEKERDQLALENGSLRAYAQVEISRQKELQEHEKQRMIKQFEESARERMHSMKSLQESLAQKDSEVSSWINKSRRLQKTMEDRDVALTKLKKCFNALQCRCEETEDVLRSRLKHIKELEQTNLALETNAQELKKRLKEQEEKNRERQKEVTNFELQIERLKDCTKNLMKEKTALLEAQEKKASKRMNGISKGTNTEHQKQEDAKRKIDEFSAPSSDKAEDFLNNQGVDVLEHLQKENQRLHSVIKLMNEELKELHHTTKAKNIVDVQHKTTETDFPLSDDLVNYLKSELEELEKELEASYSHIQFLEDQSEIPQTLEKETIYLREKVRVLKFENRRMRRSIALVDKRRTQDLEALVSLTQSDSLKEDLLQSTTQLALSRRKITELEDINESLVKENEDLMEISNAVRAELNRVCNESELLLPPPRAPSGRPYNVVMEADVEETTEKQTDPVPARKHSALQLTEKREPCVEAVHLTMSKRETASQKEKRKWLQKISQRKELQPFKNIRNYNIKDDEAYKLTLKEMQT